MTHLACEARYMQLKYGTDPIVFILARDLTNRVLHILHKLHIDFTDTKTYDRQVASVFRSIKEETFVDKEMCEMLNVAGNEFIDLNRFCMGHYLSIDAMLQNYNLEFHIEKDTFPSFYQVRSFLIGCGYGKYF